jgi:hypothetical protein
MRLLVHTLSLILQLTLIIVRIRSGLNSLFGDNVGGPLFRPASGIFLVPDLAGDLQYMSEL